jgi:biopolymer transport protein ExbB
MENSDFVSYAENALDYGIMGILLLMSVVTLWLFIERQMFYKTVRLDDYDNKDALELDLSDNLSTISAIGANAPYVGLLGTVIGIMLTFYSLGDIGSVDAKKIMMGLALALKATALGLVVAIPAISFYTILLRKMEKIVVKQGIIPVNLPTAKASEKNDQQKEVAIYVNSKGEIYYDKAKVSIEELEQKLSAIPQSQTVVLRSDKESRFQDFVSVMNILKRLNHEQLYIVTKD